MKGSLFVACALALSCRTGQNAVVARDEHAVPAKEIFVLPRGYRGPFIAIYAQVEGIEPRWHLDTAIFTVPASGILPIKFPEPPHSARVSHVFADKPDVWLRNVPTCADMRVYVAASDSQPSICWLDYWVGGTGIPGHIAAVVTDWAGIPANFNRTSFVYDSVLHKGTGKTIRKWTEPPELVRRPRIG